MLTWTILWSSWSWSCFMACWLYHWHKYSQVKIFCNLVHTMVKWLQLVCCTCRHINNQDPVVWKIFLDLCIYLASEFIHDQDSWLIRTVHLLSNSCDVWLEDTLGETCTFLYLSSGAWKASTHKGSWTSGGNGWSFLGIAGAWEGTGHQELLLKWLLSDAYLPNQQGHPFSSFFFHCPLTSWDNPV